MTALVVEDLEVRFGAVRAVRKLSFTIEPNEIIGLIKPNNAGKSSTLHAIMGAAPKDRQGVAAGMLAPGRTTGQSLSVAIAGAVFVGLGSAAAGRALLQHPHDPALAATFLRGFQWALRTCAILSAAAIVTSLLRGREQVHSTSSSPSPASGPLASSRISPAT